MAYNFQSNFQKPPTGANSRFYKPKPEHKSSNYDTSSAQSHSAPWNPKTANHQQDNPYIKFEFSNGYIVQWNRNNNTILLSIRGESFDIALDQIGRNVTKMDSPVAHTLLFMQENGRGGYEGIKISNQDGNLSLETGVFDQTFNCIGGVWEPLHGYGTAKKIYIVKTEKGNICTIRHRENQNGFDVLDASNTIVAGWDLPPNYFEHADFYKADIGEIMLPGKTHYILDVESIDQMVDRNASIKFDEDPPPFPSFVDKQPFAADTLFHEEPQEFQLSNGYSIQWNHHNNSVSVSNGYQFSIIDIEPDLDLMHSNNPNTLLFMQKNGRGGYKGIKFSNRHGKLSIEQGVFEFDSNSNFNLTGGRLLFPFEQSSKKYKVITTQGNIYTIRHRENQYGFDVLDTSNTIVAGWDLPPNYFEHADFYKADIGEVMLPGNPHSIRLVDVESIDQVVDQNQEFQLGYSQISKKAKGTSFSDQVNKPAATDDFIKYLTSLPEFEKKRVIAHLLNSSLLSQKYSGLQHHDKSKTISTILSGYHTCCIPGSNEQKAAKSAIQDFEEDTQRFRNLNPINSLSHLFKNHIENEAAILMMKISSLKPNQTKLFDCGWALGTSGHCTSGHSIHCSVKRENNQSLTITFFDMRESYQKPCFTQRPIQFNISNDNWRNYGVIACKKILEQDCFIVSKKFLDNDTADIYYKNLIKDELPRLFSTRLEDTIAYQTPQHGGFCTIVSGLAALDSLDSLSMHNIELLYMTGIIRFLEEKAKSNGGALPISWAEFYEPVITKWNLINPTGAQPLFSPPGSKPRRPSKSPTPPIQKKRRRFFLKRL